MEVPARVVLASANPKKAAELREVLAGAWGEGVELLARPDAVAEVSEDAEDFLGNARLKAAALLQATGEAALADDSGLEVDGLGGAPGVRSARYAGPGASDADNVTELLAALATFPEGHPARRARFRCVVVLLTPTEEIVGRGTVEGCIALSPRGGGGFGYDPVFVPEEGDGRTFAEMTAEEKHAISHRGRALDELRRAIEVE
jgi:XTP/dITP diphosphohydrolase